jgi:hypothetical protein
MVPRQSDWLVQGAVLAWPRAVPIARSVSLVAIFAGCSGGSGPPEVDAPPSPGDGASAVGPVDGTYAVTRTFISVTPLVTDPPCTGLTDMPLSGFTLSGEDVTILPSGMLSNYVEIASDAQGEYHDLVFTHLEFWDPYAEVNMYYLLEQDGDMAMTGFARGTYAFSSPSIQTCSFEYGVSATRMP